MYFNQERPENEMNKIVKNKIMFIMQMTLMIRYCQSLWRLDSAGRNFESKDVSPEQQHDRSPMESRHWWWWLMTSINQSKITTKGHLEALFA